jgi:hypothetical protein
MKLSSDRYNKHNKRMFKKIVYFLILILMVAAGFGGWPEKAAQAAQVNDGYPKIANYYLRWDLSEAEIKELANWGVVILDMEIQENHPEQLQELRQLNPNIKILAYIPSEEITENPASWTGFTPALRQYMLNRIDPSWWLKDETGKQISVWPGTYMLNLSDVGGASATGERFNDFLSRFIAEKIAASGLWDGVMLDSLWGSISTTNGGHLDLNNDGQIDSKTEANAWWHAGVKELLTKTRALVGNNFIIVGNGTVTWDYQPLLNGMMFESFPTRWESNGTWTGVMNSYEKINAANQLKPQVNIINGTFKDPENYQHFRFDLASALMENGYFSYDYDVSNHGQLWWYDEYQANLGAPQGVAHNLLDNNKITLEPGLWRRNFDNGIVLVNSTNQTQKYSFAKEEFDRLRGTQDKLVNNGQRINWIKLAPQDGLLLLHAPSYVPNSWFKNGDFYRIFNDSGQQVQNGFFSYLDGYSGSQSLLVSDSGFSQKTILAAWQGSLDIYQQGQKVKSFRPYNAYRGNFMMAVGDLNNNGQTEIITGAGPGGGPQVRIFDSQGHVKGSFFAYDKNFRGGINVAVQNVNNGAKAEILTGSSNF